MFLSATVCFKGQSVEVGAGTRRGNSFASSKPKPTTADNNDIPTIKMPKVPKSSDIVRRGTFSDVPDYEPRVISKPKEDIPEPKRYITGQEVLFKGRSTVFNGGTADFHNPPAAKRSLNDAYVSLIQARHMKVIIQATTNLTWSSHTGTVIEGSGGKTLNDLLNDRAQAS